MWTPTKVQKASASTAPEPETVESPPTTSEEVKIPPTSSDGDGNMNGNGNGFEGELRLEGQPEGTDWSKSYHGLSSQAFSKEIAEVLLAPIDPLDVEMKPGAYSFLLLPAPFLALSFSGPSPFFLFFFSVLDDEN